MYQIICGLILLDYPKLVFGGSGQSIYGGRMALGIQPDTL